MVFITLKSISSHILWTPVYLFVLFLQYEVRRPKAPGDLSPSEIKVSISREREEHKKLLAESHGLVMDLRRQVQQSEKNWSREKGDLLDQLEREKREWEKQREEFLWKIEQVLNIVCLRAIEFSEVIDISEEIGAGTSIFILLKAVYLWSPQ